MTAPAGSDLQFGYGFELADNRPKTITDFMRVKSISQYKTKRNLEVNENLDPNGQTVRGVNSQAMLATKIDVQPDVDSIVKLRAHHLGDYAITNPSGACYQFLCEPYLPGASVPSYVDSLAFEVNTGDGYPILTYGNRQQGLDLKIQEGKLVECSMDFLGCYESYMSAAATTATAGTATGRWLIRGPLSNPTVGANAIKIKAIDPGGDGVATVEVTQGATPYATPKTTVVYDTWMRVVGPSSARYGVSRFDDLYIMYSTDGGTGGTFTAADEWAFSSTRTAATASYSTRNVLTAAGAEFTINGTTYYVHSCDVKITRPRKARFNVGSKYATTIQKNGKFAVSISISRDYDDRAFLTALQANSDLTNVLVTMYGDNITGTYDEKWAISVPYMQVANQDADISNDNVVPEKIDLIGYRNSSTQLLTETIWTTKSTI